MLEKRSCLGQHHCQYTPHNFSNKQIIKVGIHAKQQLGKQLIYTNFFLKLGRLLMMKQACQILLSNGFIYSFQR